MQLHTFVNMYLSPIQNGIQTAHLVQELNNKYWAPASTNDILRRWATDHKTIIVHNGGYSSNLLRLYDSFSKSQYPFAKFHEEDDALAGALTVVGIIVPQHIIEYAKLYRDGASLGNSQDLEVIMAIADHRLA